MKLSCDIIRDLLPLYAEELASGDSQEAVREHLDGCEDCRRTYEKMKESPVIIREDPGLNTVRRGLWKRRLLTALCAVLKLICTTLINTAILSDAPSASKHRTHTTRFEKGDKPTWQKRIGVK